MRSFNRDARVGELLENVAFIESKLKETRDGLANAAVVIAYDNGGGQKGVRRNPAFDGYNALVKTYVAALSELRSILDDQDGTGPTAGLEQFKVIRGNVAVGE